MFTFGLGSGCDTELVKMIAKNGRGTATIVGDNDDNLNGLVIQALSASMEPSLCDVKYGFNSNLKEAGELYRNKLVVETTLIKKANLGELIFSLNAKGKEKKDNLDLVFTRKDFHPVPESARTDLLKLTVYNNIRELGGTNPES